MALRASSSTNGCFGSKRAAAAYTGAQLLKQYYCCWCSSSFCCMPLPSNINQQRMRRSCSILSTHILTTPQHCPILAATYTAAPGSFTLNNACIQHHNTQFSAVAHVLLFLLISLSLFTAGLVLPSSRATNSRRVALLVQATSAPARPATPTTKADVDTTLTPKQLGFTMPGWSSAKNCALLTCPLQPVWCAGKGASQLQAPTFWGQGLVPS